LSVEYRLAPEYKFPTAVDDAEAAWHWAAAHAPEFLCQPHRIVMGGDSAGGNLSAAVVARLAAKNARCPEALLLLYPSLDMTLSLSSVQSLGEGYFLTRAGICWFRDHYMNTTSEYTSVDASPLLSLHLDRFPRTVVVTASADPLVDDGRVFADALQSRQVPVSYKCFEGVVHGFMNMFTIFPEAEAALRWVSMELNVTNTYDTGLKR
jgi:acetyl esterase